MHRSSEQDELEFAMDAPDSPPHVNGTVDMLAPRLDDQPTEALPRRVVTTEEMSARIQADYAEAIARDRRRNRVLARIGVAAFLAGSFLLGTQLPTLLPEVEDAVSDWLSPTAGISIEAVPTSTIEGEAVGVVPDGTPYVTGRLLNPDGTPAAGAEVSYNVYGRDGEGMYSVSATCGEDGSYLAMCANEGEGWKVGSVEYVGDEIAPGGYLTRDETAEAIAETRSDHELSSVACEGDSAPEDGSLGRWGDGYYLVHDWSDVGKRVLAMSPGDKVTVDGDTLIVAGTRDVPRSSTVGDVRNAYSEKFDVVIQTCLPDDESNMRIVYLVEA